MVTRWISVTEELPSASIPVLIYAPGGTYVWALAIYDPEPATWKGIRGQSLTFPIDGITHWSKA